MNYHKPGSANHLKVHGCVLGIRQPKPHQENPLIYIRPFRAYSNLWHHTCGLTCSYRLTFIWLLWRQLAAGRSLKFTNCRGG